MKIVHVETILKVGAFAHSAECAELRDYLHAEIERVVWPPESDKFTIYPESGKKSGEGNGVKPIKLGLMAALEHDYGWICEEPLDIAKADRCGDIDAVKYLPDNRAFALEWETGNVSSSHRAINKMALGLVKGVLIGGVLVVPTKAFAKFLTDRIGNFEEIRPYFPLWQAVRIEEGLLEVVAIEHDDKSFAVPKIPKATDGWALIQKKKADDEQSTLL